MTPDFGISLQFLAALYPTGPWTITAISVDKKSIRAKTSTDKDELRAWLEDHDKMNLYYSVNQPTVEGRTKTKLSKEDVDAVYFLHVDVDPRTGEDVKSEQLRIIKQILGYKVEPSIVIFSGGGYNALWRLEEPFQINGAVENAIDVERRNWQLELDFDTPDHCRDVSRILRLPGTINRPDAKKKEKGRVAALATIEVLNDKIYPLSTFGATPHVSTNKSEKSNVTDNIVRCESLDNLDIPEKLKVIIAQGFDPEDKKWDGDRSAVLYRVCCDLVRAGLKDEQILGIITDSRYMISESVLDKGSGVMRYANRQVERARDNADHPMLGKMNDQFSVVLSYGNQTVVMVEKGHFNEFTQRFDPVFQTFHSFKDRIKRLPPIEYALPSGKTKTISVFDWWTSHPRRREYNDVTFEPGLDTPGRYNFWTGFAVQPVTGELHERLLEHVHANICAGDEKSYEYLVNWMARVVQTPRTRSMVVPVLLGERGTGKSVFADYFGALFEPHRFTASDIHELTGKFNAHLGSCVYVIAEEAFDLRDKRHESVLKERITGRTISIERKGLDKIQMPNYIHLIMTSNNERVVPAGDHERRFFVLRVGNDRMQDSEYFKKILEDQRKGGLQHLLRFLLARDIKEYDVTIFPRTRELREQQEHNLSLELKWLLEKLEFGIWLPGGAVRWEGPVKKRDLYEDYKSYMFGLNAKVVRGARAFHKFIEAELPSVTERQVSGADIHDKPMAFVFPEIVKCRDMFDKRRGWKESWRPLPKELSEGEAIPIHGREPVFE